MTKLECPNCHYTLPIEDWNKSVKDGIVLGVCDELIPEDLESDQWEQYANDHGGRADCPECGELVTFEDMTAY